MKFLHLFSNNKPTGFDKINRLSKPHLKALEKAGLTEGKIKYHITEKGKQILSRLDGLK
jgi:predicted transcriptional regulator